MRFVRTKILKEDSIVRSKEEIRQEQLYSAEFEKVYTDLGRPILYYLLRRLHGSMVDAEDVASIFWQYVFRKKTPLTKGILYYKAGQILVEWIRKHHMSLELVELGEIAKTNSTDSGDENLEFERFWSEFSGIDLTEQEKRLFWLHARLNLTLDEISSETGLARSTVHDKVTKVKRTCRAFLEAEEDKLNERLKA